MFAHRRLAKGCYNSRVGNVGNDNSRSPHTMASSHRNRSLEEPRLPQGMIVVAILVVVLLAGVILIAKGLF